MIYWVMGGTGVGKKWFMTRAAVLQTRPHFLPTGLLTAEWMNDGPCRVDIADRASQHDIMIRWQWGRDEHIKNIKRDCPTISQTLIMLTTDLMTQLSRIALREGGLKWNVDAITGEQRNVYELVANISTNCRLPVLYVDSTDNTYELRLRTVC